MPATRPLVVIAAALGAVAGAGLWPAAPAAAGASAPAATVLAAPVLAATGIGKPTAHGSLRITGTLRDGGTVRAAGLSWRPGALPAGDKLLSFAVSYSWQSCAAKCVQAADSTVTPFAAQRYIAGHADTSRRLRLVETASEIVETDPATFSFTRVTASAAVSSAGTVAAYPAGRVPRTEFVNGTPEQRTASDAEYLRVAAPHYNAADGTATARCRIDHGGWHALSPHWTLYTGKLAVGPHRVAVRVSNAAGSTTLRLGWRVVPMPAPVACRPRPGQACWYPPHLNSRGKPMRWDWQIGRVTPLRRTGARAVDIYDIDGFLTTAAQVHAIRTRWPAATVAHPKLVCYLDLAWEDYRPDGSPGPVFSASTAFPAATLGNIYYGYPQERWVDFRQLNALKPMLDERIAMCARKGFDAIELDDIDSFDPPSTTGFDLTPGDAQNYLAYALNEVHRYGMTVLWKNSPYLTWWARDYADGAVVEECYIYQQCRAAQLRGSSQYGITCTALAGATPCGWDVFSTDKTAAQPTGKWVGEAEYGADHYVCNPGNNSCPVPRRFSTFCERVYAPPDGFAAVKFDVNLDGGTFLPCPRGV
jgi:Glycoside-hydrolase family GH114